YDGLTYIGQAALSTSGSVTSATFRYASLTVGSHTISASYSGDSSFANSSGTLGQTVNRASTSTLLISSANPSTYRQRVFFAATVRIVAASSWWVGQTCVVVVLCRA